jgi:hypothetical protein
VLCSPVVEKYKPLATHVSLHQRSALSFSKKRKRHAAVSTRFVTFVMAILC